MDIVWLGGFGLLCAGIGVLTWACDRAVPSVTRAPATGDRTAP